MYNAPAPRSPAARHSLLALLPALLLAACLDLAAPQNTLQFQFPDNSNGNNATTGGCQGDADCPVGRICQAAMCVEGCRTSADCADGLACIGQPRRCAPSGGCFQDLDCPIELPRCHPTLLVCVECFISLDCNGDAVCNLDPACANSERACIPEDFTCGPCVNDDQCAPGVCDLEAGRCADCNSDAECPEGKYCDQTLHLCTTCTTDEHCEGNPNGPACLSTPDGGLCVSCTIDDHCGGEGTCNHDTLTCGGCRADADCRGEGLRCNASTGLCFDTTCTWRDVPALIELRVERSFPAPFLAGPPLAGPLVDLNNDGARDARDPAQLAFPMAPPSPDMLAFRVVTLDGQTVWTTSALAGGARGGALGDLDADGFAETVTLRGQRVTIHDRAGSTRYSSGTLTPNVPTLADVDQDGFAEIVAGGSVYSEIAERVWRGVAHQGGHSGLPGYGIAAQLDGEPGLEIVAGGTIYATDGALRCTQGDDGYSALGDLDGDGTPEIVVVSDEGSVRALTLGCALRWGPVIPDGASAGGGPPILADLDGDGAPEIAFVAGEVLAVLGGDGEPRWSAPLDAPHPAAACTAADLDGDNVAELLVSDAAGLQVLRGSDGFALTSAAEGRSTLPLAPPIVADVDLDGAAEIVVASSRGGMEDVVVIVGDVRDRWLDTRNLWNQHPYIDQAIEDDLGVPTAGPRWWQAGNRFGAQATHGADAPAPNLILDADPATFDSRECPDRYSVTVRLYNRGAADVGPDSRLVARFPDSPAAPVLDTSYPELIPPGEFRLLTLTFDDLRGPTTLQLTASRPEDDETTLPECSVEDNVTALVDVGCPDPF